MENDPEGQNIFKLANDLKEKTNDVRAFGIGNASEVFLNLIDSDGDAKLLSSAGELFDEFDTSIDIDTIDRIEVKKAGTASPIEIIPANKLVKKGLNLTYEGAIAGLDRSREAQNDITFELIFKDSTNIDNVTLDYTITTGQTEIRQQTNNGTKEIRSFTANQVDFESNVQTLSLEQNAVAINDRDFVGNDLDNTVKIKGGTNSIFGNGGDDRFTILGGVNFINGGEGVDTVILDQTLAEAGDIFQSGDRTIVGNNYSLVDVEFLQFSDQRILLDTLAVTPTISVEKSAISLVEGNTGSSLATFNVNLDTPSSEDITIFVDADSPDNSADIVTDFFPPTRPLTIPAGETSGEITLQVRGDNVAEGDEEALLNLMVFDHATFADGTTTETVGVNIADDDSEIFVSLIEEDLGISEGDLDQPSVFSLTLNRFGGLLDSDTVQAKIIPAINNPVVSADFSRGVTIKTVNFAIAPDFKIEDDETFKVQLSRVAGSASIFSPDQTFTIFNDDQGNSIVGNDNSDRLSGTNGIDIIEGLKGNDTVFANAGDDILY